MASYRSVIGAVAGVLSCLTMVAATTQAAVDFPNKPVTFMVPFHP